MRKDVTLTIEKPGLFLQATYQCTVHRRKELDSNDRPTWEPEIEFTLIKADMTNHRDDEFEWFYGDEKPSALARALELHQDTLEEMLSDRFREIVNDPQYEDYHD